MEKANAEFQAWATRSGDYSTHGSRSGKNLLGWGEDEQLTADQERDCLVKKKKQIQERLMYFPKKHPARKALGAQQHKLDLQINKLRPKAKCKGIVSYIMDVLRDELTPIQWDTLHKKAKKRHAEDMAKE